MKVVRNILKWILCVTLAYSVIFTIINIGESAEGIIVLNNNEKYYNEIFNEESIKSSDDMMRGYFDNREESILDLYNKYPAGMVYLTNFYSKTISSAKTTTLSLILGIIMGTAVFLLINSKDKKEIKLVLVCYLISVAILGFIQGFQNTYGDFRWNFPNDYIIPITVAFGLVIAVRVIKQKDLANKLNAKLKEIKK